MKGSVGEVVEMSVMGVKERQPLAASPNLSHSVTSRRVAL